MHHDSVMDDKKSETGVNNDKLVPVGSIYPYKEVDSLMKLIERNYDVLHVKKLEIICAKSDSDLSEYLGDMENELFNDHLNEFTDYLIDKPYSCLEGRLIEEIGSGFSVYPKSERSEKLLEEQEKMLVFASKQNFFSEDRAFIKGIFKKVNPDLLD